MAIPTHGIDVQTHLHSAAPPPPADAPASTRALTVPLVTGDDDAEEALAMGKVSLNAISLELGEGKAMFGASLACWGGPVVVVPGSIPILCRCDLDTPMWGTFAKAMRPKFPDTQAVSVHHTSTYIFGERGFPEVPQP